MPAFFSFSTVLVIFAILFFLNWIKVVREYERVVIFRLGKVLPGAKGPGLILVFAPIDKAVKVDLRTITLDVPPQDVITRDNVTVKVNAVVYYRVLDAVKAVIDVENYLYATSQLAQTHLRSVLGEVELDDLLSKREQLNLRLQEILDRDTDPGASRCPRWRSSRWTCPRRCSGPWPSRPRPSARSGPRSSTPRANWRPPSNCRKRPRCSASEKAAILLRYLQTLTEIGVEKNTTVVFPLPIELLTPFLEQEVDPGGLRGLTGDR